MCNKKNTQVDILKLIYGLFLRFYYAHSVNMTHDNIPGSSSNTHFLEHIASLLFLWMPKAYTHDICMWDISNDICMNHFRKTVWQ